jgi:type II secretory pathway pseudopilin PulG
MTGGKMTSEIKRGQRGYALLMVLSFLAIMAVGATAAAVTWTTMGTREKESELAWRGNQYVRAIKLYYKKYGRYPKTLADLTDYHSGQPRFIRQAYKDPMNTKDDGAWRLIFVLPNGQLQGSVMHKTLSLGGLGGLVAGANQNPLGGQTNPNNNSVQGGSIGTAQGQTPPTNGQTPATGGDTTQGQDQQQPPTFGSGQVFGGSIVGVASKVERPSIRVYQGGDTYFKWEFIWDPTSPSGTIQPAAAPPTGLPGSGGQNPPNQQTPPSQQTPQTPPIDH